MAVATLAQLITAVRAEAGHALTASQGLNAVETLKHLIRRTEYELWTAFVWPELVERWDIMVQVGSCEYQFPAHVQFDQVRQVFWADKGSSQWRTVEFGIPEDAIMPYGEPSKVQTGTRIQLWDIYRNTEADEARIRLWPTPTQEGFLRIKGMRPLNCLVEDDDCCTLDPTLITLFVSAELLTRAKASDAQVKDQKAQRHLKEILGNKVSAKNKVSTMGATRGPTFALRAGIDYIA